MCVVAFLLLVGMNELFSLFVSFTSIYSTVFFPSALQLVFIFFSYASFSYIRFIFILNLSYSDSFPMLYFHIFALFLFLVSLFSIFSWCFLLSFLLIYCFIVFFSLTTYLSLSVSPYLLIDLYLYYNHMCLCFIQLLHFGLQAGVYLCMCPDTNLPIKCNVTSKLQHKFVKNLINTSTRLQDLSCAIAATTASWHCTSL